MLPLTEPSFSCTSNNMLSDYARQLPPFCKYQQHQFLPHPCEPSGISSLCTELPPPDTSVNTVSNFAAHRSLRTSTQLLTGCLSSEAGNSHVGLDVSPMSALPAVSSNSRVNNNTIQATTAEGIPSFGESLGTTASKMPCNGFSLLLCSSSPTSPLGYSLEKTFSSSSCNWGSLSGSTLLTTDFSKRGLENASIDALDNFTSQGGFTERAMKFSRFNTQTCVPFAPAFPLTEVEAKTCSRFGTQFADQREFSGVLSFPPAQNNVPDIHLGTMPPAAETLDSIAAVENCSCRSEKTARNEDFTCVEDIPDRASYPASVIEFTTKAQKHVRPMNNSDEADGSVVGQGESSVSDQDAYFQENASKKRKSSCKHTPLHASRLPSTNHSDKDSKSAVSDGPKVRRLKRERSVNALEEKQPGVKQSISGNTGDSTVKECSKPLETPKADYVHVRARRGQATDSHSLAERARREKISVRMKLLQDLVPGCSKITGKAVMLDEIINYVQSLQRQVEFLSMKLAAVSSRFDLNLDGIFNGEMFQLPGVEPNVLFAQEDTNPSFYQPPQFPLHVNVSCGLDAQPMRDATDSALRIFSNIEMASTESYGEVLSQRLHKAHALKQTQGFTSLGW